MPPADSIFPVMDALNHRERVLLALAHEETDRVPIAMVCASINPPARAELERMLQAERGIGVDEYLQPILDIATVGPEYVGPPLAESEDMWGVVRKAVSYGSGSYNEIDVYPLAEAGLDEIARHRWPSTDWFDYSAVAEGIAAAHADEPTATIVYNMNVFETSWYMRGFERALLEAALDPTVLDEILARVTTFYLAHTRRILESAGDELDLVFTADDIGGQNGLLMSPDVWRAHIKPHHAEINRTVHEFGARVIYHSDGAVSEAVEDLIDMGIDVLQALQFDAAGMDPVDLKTRFGGRLCFQGGVSVQQTLPFGSADDVRAETRDRIAVLGAGGGYILGPSHAIQAGTPPENILAMFDSAMRPS